MSVSLNGTNGLTFADSTTQNTGGYTGFRNRIINGDMKIDQRNAGASVTPAAAAYTLDRWSATMSQASKFSVQQNAGSVTPPVGFTNYLGCTSVSAYSLLTTDTFGIIQRIEGFNVADLGWGTANAQTVTLSFWVRSSLTGAFGGSIRNGAADRSYPFSFSISSANTWEQKTITISGDTAGTWLTNNGTGLVIKFSIGAGATQSGTAGAWAAGNYDSATGATSIVGTSGATFYITGVQLEKGSVATPFEFRPYGMELQLCQRYFQRNLGISNESLPVQLVGGYTFAPSWYKWIVYPLPVQMRASPTVIWYPNCNSISEPGKARYYTSTNGGSGNNLSPYGTETAPNYIFLKVYNEHNSFTCYGVGASYDAIAEI